jgi:hypothetical protein
MTDETQSSDQIAENANTKTVAAMTKAKAGSGHAKFRKLAAIRTKAAIRAMRLLAKMGRSQVFEYTNDEATKIIAALEAEIEALKKGLAEPQHQTDIEFDF